jgi:hypothetical protein
MSLRPSWIVAAAAAIAAIAVVGVVAVSVTGPVDGRAVAAPALQMSDEEQVSDLVDRFESAWNAEDFAELRTLLCDEVRSQELFSVAGLTELRADAGRWALTINSIDVRGDTATAEIEESGEGAQDIGFAREDGEWRWCEA